MSSTSRTPKHLVCLPGGRSSAAHIPSYTPHPRHQLTPLSHDNQFALHLHQLDAQATRINQLAAELEEAVKQFKVTASQVNQSSYTFREVYGNDWFPKQICDYQGVSVPKVSQTPNGRLSLSSHPIDLFAQERDAHQLANLLRKLSN
ncbi:hypothetical protein PN462_06795 [Spirulina sp. CS-785/01]|uniref:hypothetical protein n=1 Tax=Spirulina sp. CS-785/01 TaxID=3021716 RepID=UPI0023310940|nr:hypothetical protein [Spirulina sp. CS-785/01]MDB9312803.1 hypothetical protein [Spirulina sp. CS-785/01]